MCSLYFCFRYKAGLVCSEVCDSHGVTAQHVSGIQGHKTMYWKCFNKITWLYMPVTVSLLFIFIVVVHSDDAIKVPFIDKFLAQQDNWRMRKVYINDNPTQNLCVVLCTYLRKTFNQFLYIFFLWISVAHKNIKKHNFDINYKILSPFKLVKNNTISIYLSCWRIV